MLGELVSKTWKALPKHARTFITRRFETKFTVSVTGIVVNDVDQVLLLNHVIRPKSPWGPPGGFVEQGEQPEAALRREIKEETGLGLADVHLIRARTFKRHVEIIYTARAIGEARASSVEIRELRWFDPHQMPEDMGLDLHFAIRKALDRDEL